MKIKEGWNEANELRYESAIPPPLPDITSVHFDPNTLEFKADEILSEVLYNHRYKDSYGAFDIWEGIVLENEYNSEYKYTNIYILITKIGRKEEYLQVNSKVWITLDNLFEAKNFIGKAGLSWLDEILKPGRNIRFSFVESGGSSGSKYFTFIKYLPAKR